jgi:outer membrane protein assembly factor BamB
LYSYSIISLDATTGKLNWYYQLFHSLARGHDQDFGSVPNLFSVTIDGVTHQAVGLGNKNGVYYVLDRTDGKLLASYPVGTTEAGITGVAGFYYPTGTVNPEIFIPSADKTRIHNKGVMGVVEALVPSTKTSAWRVTTPGDIDGSVAVVPGAVLFGDSYGNLYGVSISSGGQLWHTTIPFGVQAGVTAAEGYVFVGNFDRNSPGPASGLGLYAFTADSSQY